MSDDDLVIALTPIQAACAVAVIVIVFVLIRAKKAH